MRVNAPDNWVIETFSVPTQLVIRNGSRSGSGTTASSTSDPANRTYPVTGVTRLNDDDVSFKVPVT